MTKTSIKRRRQEPESVDQPSAKRAKVLTRNPSTIVQSAVALQLPPELLLEIISHFNFLPVPYKDGDQYCYEKILPEVYLERTDILRALSQTCQHWRQMFLPMQWQRLDVVSSHSSSGAWYKTLGESLIRKSQLVCEMPELASYVRSVSVCLSRYSMSRVLPALVSMIEHLPNLETLQIIRTHHHMVTPLKEAFQGHVFPHIRSLSLPSYAHHILRSCPNVTKVSCTDYNDGSRLVSAIRKECKNVEEVEGFWGRGNIIKRLTKAAPRLKAIKLNLSYCDVASLQPLKEFKYLQTIVLAHMHLTEATYPQYATHHFGAMIQLAKDALKESKSPVETKSGRLEGRDWVKKFDLGIPKKATTLCISS